VNFHFHTTDAFMDSMLGGGIDREHEIGIMRNLFEGGADTTAMPRADSISVTVGPYEVHDDPEHPDSTRHYQVIAARSFDLVVKAKNTTDEVAQTRHEYRVVRGAAAVVVPGQPADERHWYFWDWIERPGFLVEGLAGGPDALPPGAPPLALRRPPTPLTGALDVAFSLPMTASSVDPGGPRAARGVAEAGRRLPRKNTPRFEARRPTGRVPPRGVFFHACGAAEGATSWRWASWRTSQPASRPSP
jgi:hypothetical protein